MKIIAAAALFQLSGLVALVSASDFSTNAIKCRRDGGYTLSDDSAKIFEDNKEAMQRNGLDISALEYGLYLIDNGFDYSDVPGRLTKRDLNSCLDCCKATVCAINSNGIPRWCGYAVGLACVACRAYCNGTFGPSGGC